MLSLAENRTTVLGFPQDLAEPVLIDASDIDAEIIRWERG